MSYHKVGFAGLMSVMLWFAPVIGAEPFAEDWAESWPVVLEQRSGDVTRRPGGTLEIDTETDEYADCVEKVLADGLSVVKMRQVHDPDQIVIPLYWRPSTLPFFSNYCIVQGKSLGDLYKMKVYRIRRAPKAPRVDGKLDDEAWSKLTPATEFFILGRSSKGKQATRAWRAYDDAKLYVAFDCQQTARGINISSEKLWGRDAVDIALNPSGDRTTFLQIIADAAGEFDQFSHTADGSKFKWDGIKVASGKYDGG